MSDGTTNPHGLRFGSLGDGAIHLCIDMQNMFAAPTAWHTPSMMRILPNVERIARRHPARTIFTRFVPAQNAAAARGTWGGYYRYWHAMTLDELEPRMVDLLPSLHALLPLADVIDKTTYAPWIDGDLDDRLQRRGVDTLIVTGGETDVCGLATVLGGVDRGYRVVVVVDALCSGSDEMHDATIRLYGSRYDRQVEAVTTEQVLEAWN